MAVITSEGIIIKRINFGEADRLLTVATPYRGKIKILAKGVRRITSRRGGNVELLNKIKFQTFQKTGLPILTEVESLTTFPALKENLLLASYGLYLTELVERLLPEDQPNPAAYKLLGQVLSVLEKNPRQIFIRAFEIKLLVSLGYWSLDQIEGSSRTKNILEKLQLLNWLEIAKLEVQAREAIEIEQLLRYYIEKILESSLKSLKVIQKLKQH